MSISLSEIQQGNCQTIHLIISFSRKTLCSREGHNEVRNLDIRWTKTEKYRNTWNRDCTLQQHNTLLYVDILKQTVMISKWKSRHKEKSKTWRGTSRTTAKLKKQTMSRWLIFKQHCTTFCLRTCIYLVSVSQLFGVCCCWFPCRYCPGEYIVWVNGFKQIWKHFRWIFVLICCCMLTLF